MATDAPAVPRVADTGLERDDLVQAADELGIDGYESLDDQRLFEQIGLHLGQITEDQLEEADETAEGTADEVQDTAEQGIGGRRPGGSTVLDLDIGPVALDLLGLEVHLDRVHAEVAANPLPPFGILGKVAKLLGGPLKALGLNKAVDKVTDAVDTTLDVFPSPDGVGESAVRDDEADQDDDEAGVLSKLATPVTKAFHGAKDMLSDTKDAASEGVDAGTSTAGAVGNIASGNPDAALKDGKDAVGHVRGGMQRTASAAGRPLGR